MLGANVGRRRAISGHIEPSSWQVNGMSSDTWPRPATNRTSIGMEGVRDSYPLSSTEKLQVRVTINSVAIDVGATGHGGR